MAATRESGYYIRLVHDLAREIAAELGGGRGSDNRNLQSFWEAHKATILAKVARLSEDEVNGINDHGDGSDVNFAPSQNGAESVLQRFAGVIVAAALFRELRSAAHAVTVLGQPALVMQEEAPTAPANTSPAPPSGDWVTTDAVQVEQGMGAHTLPPEPPAHAAPEPYVPVSLPDRIPYTGPMPDKVDPYGPYTRAGMVALDPNATRRQKVMAALTKWGILAAFLLVIPIVMGLFLLVMRWRQHR